jgi:hypothetical protein
MEVQSRLERRRGEIAREPGARSRRADAPAKDGFAGLRKRIRQGLRWAYRPLAAAGFTLEQFWAPYLKSFADVCAPRAWLTHPANPYCLPRLVQPLLDTILNLSAKTGVAFAHHDFLAAALPTPAGRARFCKAHTHRDAPAHADIVEERNRQGHLICRFYRDAAGHKRRVRRRADGGGTSIRWVQELLRLLETTGFLAVGRRIHQNLYRVQVPDFLKPILNAYERRRAAASAPDAAASAEAADTSAMPTCPVDGIVMPGGYADEIFEAYLLADDAAGDDAAGDDAAGDDAENLATAPTQTDTRRQTDADMPTAPAAGDDAPLTGEALREYLDSIMPPHLRRRRPPP